MRLFVAVCTILLFTAGYSQKAPFKVGKATAADIQIDQCEFQPGAHAMVLGEFGATTFKYDPDDGFKFVFRHSVRIKIFDTEGYEEAEIEIPYYRGSTSANEKVAEIKGFTYNMEGGKLQKIKLSPKDIYEEDVSKNWKQVKFALPQVKEGSVIEYSYAITSDFISNLRPCVFQRAIPVAWSEYVVTIPEFFNYQTVFGGEEPLVVSEDNRIQETYTYTVHRDQIDATRTQTQGASSERRTIDSESRRYHWAAQNLPGISKEPFSTAARDYFTRIEFQLQSIDYPGRPLEVVAGTYAKINKELVEDQQYLSDLDKNNFLNSDLALLTATGDDLEKAVKIYNHLRSKVKWNRLNSMWPRNFKKAYDDGEANIATLNHLLISMYRKAGYSAHPILLSTRGNGKLHPIFPSYERFNYVVCGLSIDNKLILLDASQLYLPFGMIPEKCLNGRGWMVTTSGGQWIDLQTTAMANETTMVNITFDGDGMINTDVQYRASGYSAIDKRSEFLKKGEDQMKSDMESAFVNSEVMESTFENSDDTSQPFKIALKLQSEYDPDEHVIYVSPILMGALTSNPFEQETRKYVVDIPYKIKQKVIGSIEVPEGYLVDEIPQPTIVKLPDNKGAFIFNTSVQGNRIMLSSSMQISTLLFTSQEYQGLKQFFDMIVEKHGEQIVLKRKT